MNEDAEGGSPREGMGLEPRPLHRSLGPLDYLGREEASFLIPRLELRAIT